MPSASIPPPYGGWNTFDAVAAMGPQYAVVLDNMLPEAGMLRTRPGFRQWATGLPGRVDGLMAYRSGAGRALFAASGEGIYDITAAGPVGAPAVSGLTSALWDGIMVSAAGGQFLLAFNGQDVARQFDGSAWSEWSGTGLPAPPGWANVFKGQPFAGRRDRLSFWYGAPGAIGGAFTEFPLQGVAKRGGGVAGMATWTLDGGQGIDDYAAFFTTEGELLVYRGTNPSSASTWFGVGTYQMPRPVGRRFARQFGGDVLALTEGGVYSLKALLSGADAGALAAQAYTRAIEPSFLALTRGRGAQAGWDLVPLPSYGLWLVNAPWGGADAQQLAFRAANGAACRFVGLPAACWLEDGGQAFFGSAKGDGRVLLWGEDVADDGMVIQAEAVTAFSDFGAPGVVKRFSLAEPVLSDVATARVRLDMVLDWAAPAPSAEALGADAAPITPDPADAGLVWDLGTWDAAVWARETGAVSRAWRGVSGIGQSGAVRLRLASAFSRPGWLGTGLVWQTGGPLR